MFVMEVLRMWSLVEGVLFLIDKALHAHDTQQLCIFVNWW